MANTKIDRHHPILFETQDGLPRGTTDRVMQRLFPTQRSAVEYSNERRQQVWEILNLVGYFELDLPDE